MNVASHIPKHSQTGRSHDSASAPTSNLVAGKTKLPTSSHASKSAAEPMQAVVPDASDDGAPSQKNGGPRNVHDAPTRVAGGARSDAHMRRRNIFQDMPPQLKKMANEIRLMLTKESETRLVVHYDIGVKVRHALERDGEYGSEAVEKLAAFFEKDPSWLYAHRSVAAEYTRDRIIALAKKEMANGDHLEWGHLLCLARVKSRQERAEFEEQIYTHSLSARQLAAEIGGAGLDHRRAYGGRQPAKPASLLRGVHQVATTTEALLRRVPVWADCARRGAVDTVPKNFDFVLHRLLARATAAVRQLQVQLPEIDAALDEVRVRCEAVLAERGETVTPEPLAEKKDEMRRRSKPSRAEGSQRPEPS